MSATVTAAKPRSANSRIPAETSASRVCVFFRSRSESVRPRSGDGRSIQPLWHMATYGSVCHMTQRDRIVIVTGGTSGLGIQLAQRLDRAEGYSLVLTGRSAVGADAAARRIGARGLALDLGSLASVQAFAAEIAALTEGQPVYA